MVHALQTTRVWTSIVTPPSPSPIFYFHSYIQFFSYHVLFYSQSSAVWFVFTAPRIWKKNQIYLLRTMCSPCPEYKRAHTHTQNIIIKRYSSETDFDGLAVRTAHTPPYFSIACMRLSDQFRHSAKSLFFFILLLFHRMNGNVRSDWITHDSAHSKALAHNSPNSFVSFNYICRSNYYIDTYTALSWICVLAEKKYKRLFVETNVCQCYVFLPIYRCLFVCALKFELPDWVQFAGNWVSRRLASLYTLCTLTWIGWHWPLSEKRVKKILIIGFQCALFTLSHSLTYSQWATSIQIALSQCAIGCYCGWTLSATQYLLLNWHIEPFSIETICLW